MDGCVEVVLGWRGGGRKRRVVGGWVVGFEKRRRRLFRVFSTAYVCVTIDPTVRTEGEMQEEGVGVVVAVVQTSHRRSVGRSSSHGAGEAGRAGGRGGEYRSVPSTASRRQLSGVVGRSSSSGPHFFLFFRGCNFLFLLRTRTHARTHAGTHCRRILRWWW